MTTLTYQEAFASDGSNLPSPFQYPPHEREGIEAQKKRLDSLYVHRCPDYVDTKKAANDNEDWPLAEQLRRDGNEMLIAVAERYREVYNAAKFEPRLVGTLPDDFWSPEQKHTINKETGELKLNGQKKSKTAAALPIDDGTSKADVLTDEKQDELVAKGPQTFKRRPASPVMRKWQGEDALIAAIDARPMLDRLQSALGPLVDPFEDAVIGNMTLTEIGLAKGVNTVARSPVGKVLVMMGLDTVREEFERIDRESRVTPT